MKHLFSLALASILAGTAVAQTTAPAAAPTGPAAVTGATTPKEKVVCRTEDQVGTRLGSHRTCHTPTEWARISRDAADDLNRRTVGTNAVAGGG